MIDDADDWFERALEEKRQRIAEALANPSEENVYLATDDPSEMTRLTLAEEYVRVTEELVDQKTYSDPHHTSN